MTRVVICGSISQAATLARVATAYRIGGCDVLCPEPSDRPEAEHVAEWMSAIERADRVVVVPKPDGTLGAQTTAELRHATDHEVRVEVVWPSEVES